MGIHLYEHNKTAYDSAVSMMEKTGKAAVIHPTGTGKSYIGFHLAEETGAAVLWLSPSEYIIKSQLKNLKKDGAAELDNITYMTYTKLMYTEDLSELRPEYIIFDEFHRCGAAEWGKGVRRLLGAYPDAKILGLSATNIRYLDNHRDMADELFEGNIASEITLGEAIARNILLPPKYIISVYNYDTELKNYEERINQISKSAIRAKAKKELNALRRALEMSEGLEKVFERNMIPTGKYIVFCSGVNHMEAMLSMVPQWFCGVDEEPNIYTVYNKDTEASQKFEDFTNDNSEHLKLLYCIDMLNEGIHLDDIDGVIMFRPTVSPIIYKQQVGRALSANKIKQPVIFDVVNNFENLNSIGSIRREVSAAAARYRDKSENIKIVNNTFEIIDETRNCTELFNKLQQTISSSWECYYAAAAEYYEKHGDLNVPNAYMTEDGLNLGIWLATQRYTRNHDVPGNLGSDRIARLDAIGMIWNKPEHAWDVGYAHAKAYYEEHGNLEVKSTYVCEDGYRLGKWITQERGLRRVTKDKKLREARDKKLEAIGMNWNKDADKRWNRSYEKAKKYYDKHGTVNVSYMQRGDDEFPIGRWIHIQRTKRAAMPQERIDKLNALHINWDGAAEMSNEEKIKLREFEPSSRYEIKWYESYCNARDYYNEYGNLRVPARYVNKDGFKLGLWLTNQKRRTNLTDKQRDMLDEIGMVWKGM